MHNFIYDQYDECNMLSHSWRCPRDSRSIEMRNDRRRMSTSSFYQGQEGKITGMGINQDRRLLLSISFILHNFHYELRIAETLHKKRIKIKAISKIKYFTHVWLTFFVSLTLFSREILCTSNALLYYTANVNHVILKKIRIIFSSKKLISACYYTELKYNDKVFLLLC